LATVDHDVHHSHVACNYGGFTVIWDKLFGTYEYSVVKKRIDGVEAALQVKKKE